MSDTAVQQPQQEEATLVFQLGYASAASHPFTDEELVELLAKARAKNQALGITGMLLYHEGSFLQILEGEQKAVEDLYQIISTDSRHTDAMLLFRKEGEERGFDQWTMGFHHLSPNPADNPEGLNRFLQTGATGLKDGDGEKIRDVLLGFRSGKWRRVVDH